MANFRLSLEDFDEIDYDLIAIHSTLEDYQLAFLINRNFPVLLSRNPSDISVRTKSAEAAFSRFTFEISDTGFAWNLIANKNESVSEESTNGLFTGGSQVATTAYLLPELKKVDYFLKSENYTKSSDVVLDKLKSIDQISMAYLVDPERIRSKNNLIF